jgi:23S rRNA (guanosine2251-2'-O)-methyltransferase
MHIVEGARALAELIDAAPGRVRRVLVLERRQDEEAVKRAAALGIEVRVVDAATLARHATDGPTKGMIAFADPPPVVELEDLLATEPRMLVALDGVVDPHNLGAIIRSSEFFGMGGVFWPKDGTAPLSPAAVRASAGATERVAMAQVTNLARALVQCRDAGMWIVGTVAEGGMPLQDASIPDRLPDRLVVVLGGEHAGMRRLTRERCDFVVTIERAGQVASLNVSAAAAVVLAGLCRNRGGVAPGR